MLCACSLLSIFNLTQIMLTSLGAGSSSIACVWVFNASYGPSCHSRGCYVLALRWRNGPRNSFVTEPLKLLKTSDAYDASESMLNLQIVSLVLWQSLLLFKCGQFYHSIACVCENSILHTGVPGIVEDAMCLLSSLYLQSYSDHADFFRCGQF